jgi:DNA-binding protein YbaB
MNSDQQKLEDILIQATKLRDKLQSASAALVQADMLLKEAEALVRATLSGKLRLVVTRRK